MSKLTAAIAKVEATIAKLTEQLQEATGKLTALVAERTAIEATRNVQVGTLVIIAVGRGDTRREVEAIVRAAKQGEDDSRTLKVEYTGAFTPGFEGVIRFTPDAFSNDFAVIDSKSIVRIEAQPVTAEQAVTNGGEVQVFGSESELDAATADLEAQIAAANAQPVGLQFHSGN